MAEKTVKAVKKRRSQEEKYGKYKWIKTLVRRNAEDIRDVKRMLTGLSRGLSYLMDYESDYLLGIAVKDSRDQAILDVLRAAGAEVCCPKIFMLACLSTVCSIIMLLAGLTV